ncbi:MAG: hypothetical protein LBC70_03115 [Chitinispirillales bacterium]|jgi:uncharacterized membrane protein|nr:hypothetical protein [Chitinispirillales bacterium]
MNKAMTITEQLTYSTVRIECIKNNNEIHTGSGYFFRFKEIGEMLIPVVITNKHVIEGAQKGTLVFTTTEKGIWKAGLHGKF